MAQDLFIIGATGKVGSTLVRQILTEGDTDALKHTNPTRIVGLASSKNYIYNPDGISNSECYEFARGNSSKGKNYTNLSQILEEVKKLHRNGSLVFADVTSAGKEMTKFHLEVIRNTNFGIVAANKNPMALSDFNTFRTLTESPRRYGYICSVMAGAGSVSFIRDLRDLNDNPSVIKGCFSGTLGFLTSELEKGRDFSSIIKEAEQKGYTEPDPRDDLNGLDVARKLVVLARTAGHNVSIADVKLSKFLPDEYFADESIPDFFKRTAKIDPYFKERMQSAMKNGKTLRYVAEMRAKHDGTELEVSLVEVPLDDPLGMLKGTLNKIVIISKKYPENSPYSIEAPGAGLEVTAQNIRRDLLELLPQRKFRN